MQEKPHHGRKFTSSFILNLPDEKTRAEFIPNYSDFYTHLAILSILYLLPRTEIILVVVTS